MSILDRVRRIVKSNVNWLLDQMEPAENELEARIKELEDTIGQGRESAAVYGATYNRLKKETDSLEAMQKQLVEKAEQALKSGNDELTRKLLLEKVKVTERLGQLQSGVEQGKKNFEMLRDNLLKLQDQLKLAKLKLRDLQARKSNAEAQNAFDRQLDRVGSVEQAGAFDRLEDEVLTAEAEMEVRQEMRGSDFSDAELTDRVREMQVEAEMQALKDKIGE